MSSEARTEHDIAVDDDMSLDPIEEEKDHEDATDDVSMSAAEAETAKLDTAMFMNQVSLEMTELKNLMAKVTMGTAHDEDKKKMVSIGRKLSAMKADVEENQKRQADAEMKLLWSKNKEKALNLMKMRKESDIKAVELAVASAERVDLAFVLDCTGSMRDCIASVKNSIQRIVANVRSTSSGLKLRLAVVGYRDVGDGHLRHEVHNFDASIPAFVAFVGGLQATGGADEPEDMAGGLQRANQLDWQSPTRLIYLIADAPCHGVTFHGGADDYPSGTPGIDILLELKQLIGKFEPGGSMTLTFGRLNASTDLMLRLFQGAGIGMECKELTDMTTVVTAGVRSSIFKTITASAGKASLSFCPVEDVERLLATGCSDKDASVALRRYSIRKRLLTVDEWQDHAAIPVIVYRNVRIMSISQLKSPIMVGIFKRSRTDCTEQATMLMRRAPEPFEEGAIRIAYHGQLAKKLEDLPAEKSVMIMKVFKHIGKGLNDRKQYLLQMEVSNIAYFLASKYNDSLYRPARCSKIRFLQVYVIEEESKDKEDCGSRRFCAERPLPQLSFTKFSDNTGYWNASCLDETLLRFTRFTFEVTDGYLMVTDLQGVQTSGEYVLTDPVILCSDSLRFGNTNLGSGFMKRCMESTIALLKERGWH